MHTSLLEFRTSSAIDYQQRTLELKEILEIDMSHLLFAIGYIFSHGLFPNGRTFDKP